LLSSPIEAFIDSSNSTMRSTKMSPRIQKQIAKSREQAIAAFVSKKAEIDTMLERIRALSDDHFNYSPDKITWDHVGTLGYYAEMLKRRAPGDVQVFRDTWLRIPSLAISRTAANRAPARLVQAGSPARNRRT
jgi:hypothetical protein